MPRKSAQSSTISADPVAMRASCSDDFDSEALSVDAARARILSRITPLAETDTLALQHCLNRVLARAVQSPMNVPAHTNSAMDGYALAASDLPESVPRVYEVIGTAYAGRPFIGHCSDGQCVRVMTGAVMPTGTDTVVMQEHVNAVTPAAIRIGTGHRNHQNVRLAGEDIAKGSIVLTQGHCIQAADLGVLASIGAGEIDVHRKPVIAFFSTGDELRSLGERLHSGQLYDSNRYSLLGLLGALNVTILDLGIVKDNLIALRETIRTASSKADLIITTGGVSVGEADYVKQIVDELGVLHLWKIAMKPGRPLSFGQIGKATFFGLPGNPVSVMTTYYLFVLPAIQRLCGQSERRPLTMQALCKSNLRKRGGRYEYQRGILSLDDTGQLTVSVTGKQGSGILTSMSRANCLILLDEHCDGIEAGELVTVQPFSTYF